VACIAGLRFLSDRKLLLVSLITAAVVSTCWQLGMGDYIVGLINMTSTDETASFNVLYRQELLTQSLALIHQSPWFGVPNYMQSLENLRQGEGIIDLVNTYLVIALNVGILGVGLFLVPYGLILWKQASANHDESLENRAERRAWNPLTLAILSVAFTVSPISIVHPILIWTVALAIGRLQETLPVKRRFDRATLLPA
jgi:O-antigen ligase